ncbi:MAG TPA: phosphomannomutase/phosphoglucomutase, partial [Candidatus Nitrosotalea sp.]|nr:phosphomannomutase/phosphoglucomutase [Candidatus Nitrosotalea sp.]
MDPTIFKSYDVRGVYPSQLSDDVAYAIGRCFVSLLHGGDMAKDAKTSVVVGRDMRPSGHQLSDAFARGAADSGA